MPAPRLLLAVVVAGSFAAATVTPQAFGRTFSPSADAYVRSSKPAVNFGGAHFLRAGGRHALRGYVRFRVRTRDPIARAQLRLFVARGFAPGVRAQRVSNRWREGAITWARQPRLMGQKVAHGGAARRGRWVEVDVSSIVNRSGRYSFRLSARKGARIALWSRKADSRGYLMKKVRPGPPRLEITTAPVNTQPPTISGPTSPESVLNASPGTWRGSTPMNLAYEWRRCVEGVCSTVEAAGASSYSLKSDDLGATFQVTVTASNSAGFATATSTESAVVTSPPSVALPIWFADHETRDMSQWPSATTNWDNAVCSFHDVSQDYALSGSWSMKLTLNGPGGCRQARLDEIQTGNTYIYEASYYLPEPVLTTSNMWNVFQFKSKCGTCSNSDPTWTIDFAGNPLRPVLKWHGGEWGMEGPTATDGIVSFRQYPNTLTTVPFGQWTTLRVYLDQSAGFDGAIKVWHDGTLIYDLTGIRTQYPSLDGRWSVNNYSNGLTVNPYTLYIDDAAIYAP